MLDLSGKIGGEDVGHKPKVRKLWMTWCAKCFLSCPLSVRLYGNEHYWKGAQSRDMHLKLPSKAHNCWKFVIWFASSCVTFISQTTRQLHLPWEQKLRVDQSCVNWAAWCKLKGLVICRETWLACRYINTVVVLDAALGGQKYRLNWDGLGSLTVWVSDGRSWGEWDKELFNSLAIAQIN